MKTKFSNRELVHIWAAQGQATGSGSNMFFDGPTIFSYGRHFPIARILPGRVVLFTSKSFSTTTAKHKSYTARALSGFTVFTVPDVLAESSTDHNANAAALLKEYQAAHDNALRATKRSECHKERAEAHAKEAFDYCFEFSQVSGELKRAAKKAANRPFTAAEYKKLAARAARAVVLEKQFRESRTARYTARREAAEARMKEEAAKLSTDLEAWAAGTGDYRGGFYNLPCRLRVIHPEEGPKMVQTSHGAEVVLTDAVRLLGAWQAATVEPGVKIGPYTVESVTPDVIKIGCHTIDRAEAERVIVPAAATR